MKLACTRLALLRGSLGFRGIPPYLGGYNQRKTEQLMMTLKSRNNIQIPLDIPEVTINSVEVNEHRDYIISIESKRMSAICQYCGKERLCK